MKQNSAVEQLKQRKTQAAAEREENQRFGSPNVTFTQSEFDLTSFLNVTFSGRLLFSKPDNASPHTEFSALRMIVCNQVMKFILDKIEKDEKQAAKKRKKEEVVEQKRSKQNATKLTALLYKHKEQLKAEILKKRALLDKELQLQVQVFRNSTIEM